jgi:PhnB protein
VPTRLNPYLSFDGNARQAMEFYATVFGGKLAINTWGEFRGADSPDADRVGHAVLESDAGYTIMAGDVTSDTAYRPSTSVSVSISGDEADLLRSYWDKLSAVGTVTMPMEEQAWGDEFGMCVDQFGVSWMVNISEPAAGQGDGR